MILKYVNILRNFEFPMKDFIKTQSLEGNKSA